MFAFLPQKIPFSLHQSSALGLCSFSSAKDSISLTPITYFRSMLSFPRKSFLFDTVRTASAKCFAFVGCTAFAVCCTTKKGFLVSKLPPCCIRNPLPPCCIRRPSVLLMHGFRRMLYHEKRFLGKQASPKPFFVVQRMAQCSSMCSINIPYPFLQSWMRTWVTAPMILPS